MVTIALFAVNRKLRWRRSLFLVISMAFADLMVGAVILLIYIYAVGAVYKFWTGGWSTSLIIFYLLVDSFFMLASLNFAATLSRFTSTKDALYVTTPCILILMLITSA